MTRGRGCGQMPRCSEAVRDQNSERAATLMREHILQLADRYREIGAG